MTIKADWRWYDDTKGRSLVEKLELAAFRYKLKHGVFPTVCYISQSDFVANALMSSVLMSSFGEDKVNDRPEIAVRVDAGVQPNNFWLGIEDEKEVKVVTKPVRKMLDIAEC